MKKYLIAFLIASAAPAIAAPNADHTHVMPIKHARLGIAAISISSELRTHLGAPADRGVLVDQVQPDSPAARAGLVDGDVLIAVAGKPVQSAADIVGVLAGHTKGDRIALDVMRDGHAQKLEAVLDADMIAPSQEAPFESFEQMFDMHGLEQRLDQIEKRLEHLEHKPAA
jgi:S1-C subfamily serine protease